MPPSDFAHSHVFLGADHSRAERATWAVIALALATMVVEIVGGWMLGSLALIADGVHMSTHAGAFLLAALAYWLARRHADDPRFAFGTGKLGDLAAFTSAVILAFIGIGIGVEAIARLTAPTPVAFGEAILIAALGLCVNIVSAWLLHAGQDHGHSHGHAHAGRAHDETRVVATASGDVELSIFEEGQPPRFRLRTLGGAPLAPADFSVTTTRTSDVRKAFSFVDRGGFLESREDIPEPHDFAAALSAAGRDHPLTFAEPGHPPHSALADNNFRAAATHVLADAAVSALVIAGLLLGRAFGWLFMDPLAALAGAVVIVSWSVTLLRDAGAVLLDMAPDRGIETEIRSALEKDGDRLADLHVWRLGPGHLGAIVSVVTPSARREDFYRAKLAALPAISHLTIEVRHAA